MAKKSKKAPAKPLVPPNGGDAYKAGFTAADCPFAEGTDEFEEWNADWDAAADEHENAAVENGDNAESAEEATEREDHSVVRSEFRARYAEAGHPAHCGDELAVLLNNLCLTKKGIDMARFEHICEANGVDLSKYSRSTKGWEGRLRMTGRNILAGKVFAAGGVVKTIIIHPMDADGVIRTEYLEGAEDQYKLSAEWMTSRRKPKAE